MPEHLVPVPNPAGGGQISFRFELGAAAAEVDLKLYSSAFVLVRSARIQGSFSYGWNGASLPVPPDLASGPYFAVCEARLVPGQVSSGRASCTVEYLK